MYCEGRGSSLVLRPRMRRPLAATHHKCFAGFTIWNATLPAPSAMVRHFKRKGVHVMFNLHPHFGVQFYDAV